MDELKLFIGSYYDHDGENWLIFAAPEDCDRELELKKCYELEYGKGEILLDDDIIAVSMVGRVHSNMDSVKYFEVELKEIKK